MLALLADTQYYLGTNNMWFNSQTLPTTMNNVQRRLVTELHTYIGQVGLTDSLVENKYHETIDYRDYCLSHCRDSEESTKRSALL